MLKSPYPVTPSLLAMVEAASCRGACSLEQVTTPPPPSSPPPAPSYPSPPSLSPSLLPPSPQPCACHSPLSVHRRNVSTMASPVVLVFQGVHQAVHQVSLHQPQSNTSPLSVHSQSNVNPL